MHRSSLLLSLSAGLVLSSDSAAPVCDSAQKPRWGYDSAQNLVCYEHIRVITIEVGSASGLNQQQADCRSCGEHVRVLLADIDCQGCVTAIEPYTGPSTLTAPITTTLLPPAGSGDRPTVIIYTPTSDGLDAAPTEYIPYTGTPPITAPLTTTVRPGGTGPPTVVIQTPEVSNLGDYVTTTVPYTGTPPITRPITRTIPPTDDEAGTVIIETPAAVLPDGTSSVSTGVGPSVPDFTGAGGDEEDPEESASRVDPEQTSTPDETPEQTPEQTPEPTPEETPEPTPEPTPEQTPEETPEVTPESTPEPTPDPTPEPTEPTPDPTPEPTPESTRTGSPAGPTFDCDEGGYLIQRRTLYRLDLATGVNAAINTRVGPGGNINAMGFNILDGYLYAFVGIGNGEQQLIRIGGDGTYDLLPLIVDNGLNVGDVDDQGQMWASDAGRRWIQVDLNPDSSNFGAQVDEGVSERGNVADWVYLENGGDYLYSIRLGSTAEAQRWSRSSHEWETLRDFTSTIEGHSGFGALYAVEDELWGSDNQSGDIVAFPVLSEDEGDDARRISDGPATSSNDGARCFRAPAPGLA
ncbi:hypothetical protein NLU13_5185 [Sarocladium strictum]|uniref:DUF6923 domain-containing protein n=1 Tax=Sarocladium strictum TaxID=5046 RepID=A0AA39GGE1_SARSR|nr:hypothetical protein NLU13_5185 [Sarocladium strictum]